MKTAIYPGSFNPWHEGHTDILRKALSVFDEVIIAAHTLKENGTEDHARKVRDQIRIYMPEINPDVIGFYGKLFADLVKSLLRAQDNAPMAVIRGLRNGNDLQYEQNMQYWNEDLGLPIPTVYFIADRNLAHISGTIKREVDYLRGK